MDTELLSERLHLLADDAPLPGTPAADDVRRGRRRLRARRLAGAGGATALAAALAGVVLGTVPAEQAQDPAPQPAERTVADRPAPRAVQNSLAERVEALSDGGDGGDKAVIRLDRLQHVSDTLRTRLAGPVGWLSFETATSWRSVGADRCPNGWACEAARVRGADRARWAESGTVHQLAVAFAGTIHVFTFNTEDERPAEVAWSTR